MSENDILLHFVPAGRAVPHDPKLTASVLRRFCAKILPGYPNECWPWRGAINTGSGYGYLWTGPGSRSVYAHRIAGVLAGKLKSVSCHYRDDFGLHSCDNPPCANPAHISAGTRMDNSRDAMRKGRLRGMFRPGDVRGERNHSAKLTAADVLEVRALIAAGAGTRAIAAAMGVAPDTIGAIDRGLTWAWLEGPIRRKT